MLATNAGQHPQFGSFETVIAGRDQRATPVANATAAEEINPSIARRVWSDKYVRTLFVQAAHVILVKRPRAATQGLMPWIERTLQRMHRNLVAIALANKLKRFAWAVLARGRTYQPRSLAHAA